MKYKWKIFFLKKDDSIVPLTVAPWRSYVINDEDEETSIVLIFSDPFQSKF